MFPEKFQEKTCSGKDERLLQRIGTGAKNKKTEEPPVLALHSLPPLPLLFYQGTLQGTEVYDLREAAL